MTWLQKMNRKKSKYVFCLGLQILLITLSLTELFEGIFASGSAGVGPAGVGPAGLGESKTL